MLILGQCPYCQTGHIEVRKKEINGKKVELYACSNAHWQTEDGELFELTSTSLCHFRIWQNALQRYGKYLKQKEVKALLNNEEVIVSLYSKKYQQKIEYKKYITLNKEFGVTIIWDIDIETPISN